jgi:hypothetical protein
MNLQPEGKDMMLLRLKLNIKSVNRFNQPKQTWSALYVACIFFMLISLGVLVFMQFNK